MSAATLDFAAYEALFNSGDDRALVDRFFCDDVIFTGGTQDRRGKAALLDFLDWAHDGVREVMRPQNVLHGENLIFAEIDMDFHATETRLDFSFGPMLPGDSITVKFFVTYGLRDGKVATLRSMTWPLGKGVSTLPLLGPHPSQIAAFHAYLAAFGNADCDRFARFYADDVELNLRPDMPPLRGPGGIVDFYRPMFETVRERLMAHSVEASETAIVLDATMVFTAIRDAPDFILGALREGDTVTGRVFVDYALRDGLIAGISVRRQGELTTHRHA